MTKLSELNIKVLKKCSECNIYPSFKIYKGYGFRTDVLCCPKCLKYSDNLVAPRHLLYSSSEEVAQYRWNQLNGFDRHNPKTWTDEVAKEDD